MNIIFLEAVQDHGGARKSTIELARRLNDGLQTNTLIVDFYGSNADFIADVKKSGTPFQILEKRDKPFILKNKNKLKELGNYARFFAERSRLKKKLQQIIDTFAPDFFIVNNSKTLSLIPKSEKYKTILFARGWFIDAQISLKDKIVYKRKADHFVAVSQATRQALYCSKIADLDKIFVVKNGFPIDPALLDISQKNNNILTMVHSGSFLASKGHHVTVEISRILKQLGIPHKIFLTGKVHEAENSLAYLKEIQQIIANNDLSAHIELIINSNNILQYIKAADIFLHPSDTEGLPRVVMEAMAMKTLVIANPVGGVTDYILDGYTGFLADFNNADHYVKIILRLIEMPQKKDEIVENAFTLIRECYSPETQVNEMKRVLNSIQKIRS